MISYPTSQLQVCLSHSLIDSFFLNVVFRHSRPTSGSVGYQSSQEFVVLRPWQPSLSTMASAVPRSVRAETLRNHAQADSHNICPGRPTGHGSSSRDLEIPIRKMNLLSNFIFSRSVKDRLRRLEIRSIATCSPQKCSC